jgi:hypothetical protein
MVKAMAHRLQEEAQYTGGGFRKQYLPRGGWMDSTRIGDGFYRQPREAPHRKIPIPKRFPREALMEWAQKNDVRPRFLFEDDPEPSKVKKDNSPTMQQKREDALRSYLMEAYPGKDLKALPVKKKDIYAELYTRFPDLFEIEYKSTFIAFWKKQSVCTLVNF